MPGRAGTARAAPSGAREVNAFHGARVTIVPSGEIISHAGQHWTVEDDMMVVTGDTIYTTEDGYADALTRLSRMNHVASRYLQ